MPTEVVIMLVVLGLCYVGAIIGAFVTIHQREKGRKRISQLSKEIREKAEKLKQRTE